MLALDTETTGLDYDKARIIQVGVVTTEDKDNEWLLKTVDIVPWSSTAIHGISTEDLDVRGTDPAQGFQQIAALLDATIERKELIVAFNAEYDLTLLYREFRRYGIAQPQWANLRLIDPYIMHMIATRVLVERSLDALSKEYNFPKFNAHNAIEDARRAREVAYAVGSRFRRVAMKAMPFLTSFQRSERKKLLTSAAKAGGPPFDSDQGWPIVDIPNPPPAPRGTAEQPARSHEKWSDGELAHLHKLVSAGEDWQIVARTHERTVGSVFSKALDNSFIPYDTEPPGE